MKITIEEKNTKEVELPLYFQSKQYEFIYIMTIGEKSAVKVSTLDLDPKHYLYPSIEIIGQSQVEIYTQKGFKPISETEFKLKYTEVSIRIESLLN